MMRGRRACILLFRSHQRKNFFRIVESIANEFSDVVLHERAAQLAFGVRLTFAA
jgi:hypothetical protein